MVLHDQQQLQSIAAARVARISFALAISGTVLGMIGCAEQPELAGPEAEIQSQLDAATSLDVTVEVRDLVDDWETLTMVCRGAIEPELGDEADLIAGIANIESPGFLALLLFIGDEGELVSSANVGQNVYRATNFDPCPVGRTSNVMRFSGDVQIQFEYSHEKDLWEAFSVRES